MKITEMQNVIEFGRVSYQTKRYAGKGKRSRNNTGVRVKIGFNAAGTMAKIASAETRSQVSAIERSLRELLKTAKRYDSEESTIRAIKRTIGKAGMKRKALVKEERMENLKKIVEKTGNIKEEIRITDELSYKRNSRKRKERADILDQNSIYEKNNAKNYIDVMISDGEEYSEMVQSGEVSSVDISL